MKLKKGITLIFFPNQTNIREELIIKASNNRLTGEIITNKNTYSTDFIMRWVELGIITIK